MEALLWNDWAELEEAEYLGPEGYLLTQARTLDVDFMHDP